MQSAPAECGSASAAMCIVIASWATAMRATVPRAAAPRVIRFGRSGPADGHRQLWRPPRAVIARSTTVEDDWARVFPEG